jgi:uncharacterized protein (DUF2336 family)
MKAVREGGQERLRAVSSRPSVSEALSSVIVERGDDETLGALLRNDGARLSRASSEAAVDRARANPALHEAVVNRASLPPDLLNEMYFVVEARLRQQILEQNAKLDPALLENALEARAGPAWRPPTAFCRRTTRSSWPMCRSSRPPIS